METHNEFIPGISTTGTTSKAQVNKAALREKLTLCPKLISLEERYPPAIPPNEENV